jgi:hypothetical protein
MTTAVSTPSVRAAWPWMLALVLMLAGVIAHSCGRSAADRELQWELRTSGWLASGHWADTRIANATAITRLVTVTIPAPTCSQRRFKIVIANHNGKGIYEDRPGCNPVVAPVPAGKFVDVSIGGSGTYELALSLR